MKRRNVVLFLTMIVSIYIKLGNHGRNKVAAARHGALVVHERRRMVADGVKKYECGCWRRLGLVM